MKTIPSFCLQLQGKLIVSCQASEGDAFRDSASMVRFAKAAIEGGAVGIRAEGVEDIRHIRQAIAAPIIGIRKLLHPDGEILITPGFESARELVAAGADLIALDCTLRGQRYGALERLRRIKSELGVPVLADIATVDEAIAAADAGADFVLSTLRGYTADTKHIQEFDAGFIRELASAVEVPVIAEGRIETGEQAAAAMEAGAFAVVVGTAITRPTAITRRFTEALAQWERSQAATAHFIGIDLGGTNTKFGIVSRSGDLAASDVVATPAAEGRQVLLEHLKSVALRCQHSAREENLTVSALGIATAGWVDPDNGRVAYATDNLPGWTGAEIAAEVGKATGLPVAVENDANALAVAERHFGAGRDVDHFVCITLGTGVGGGCYIGGHLNRGAHFFANALGHIPIVPDGEPCTCGKKGCLEVYANAAALIRYAGLASAEEVITASNSGDVTAREAVRTLARYLAIGCASIIHLVDPELLVISGGLAQNNPALFTFLEEELDHRVIAREQRRLKIRPSTLGYLSGVQGAAAIAIERMRCHRIT